VTACGTALARRFGAALEDLRDHDRQEPAEADAIVCSLVAELRTWRPVRSLTEIALEQDAPLAVDLDEQVRLAGEYPADEDEAAPDAEVTP